jgi:hypothetical protein
MHAPRYGGPALNLLVALSCPETRRDTSCIRPRLCVQAATTQCLALPEGLPPESHPPAIHRLLKASRRRRRDLFSESFCQKTFLALQTRSSPAIST